jgi:hypothetical protein
VTSEVHQGTTDEPSTQDFETAEEEDSLEEPRRALFRIARLAVTSLLIFALLLYFAMPLNNMFSSVTYQLRLPGMRRIPLAPPQKRSPKLLSSASRDSSSQSDDFGTPAS